MTRTQRRKRIGLARDDLARRIGVSERTLRRWENGSHKPISEFAVIRWERALAHCERMHERRAG